MPNILEGECFFWRYDDRWISLIACELGCDCPPPPSEEGASTGEIEVALCIPEGNTYRLNERRGFALPIASGVQPNEAVCLTKDGIYRFYRGDTGFCTNPSIPDSMVAVYEKYLAIANKDTLVELVLVIHRNESGFQLLGVGALESKKA